MNVKLELWLYFWIAGIYPFKWHTMYITDKQLLNKDDLYQDESFFEYYGVIKFSWEWSNPIKPKGFTLDIITLLASEYLLNTGHHQPLNWKFVVCLPVKFLATFESNMNLTYMYFTFQCQLECLEKCLRQAKWISCKISHEFFGMKIYTEYILILFKECGLSTNYPSDLP